MSDDSDGQLPLALVEQLYLVFGRGELRDWGPIAEAGERRPFEALRARWEGMLGPSEDAFDPNEYASFRYIFSDVEVWLSLAGPYALVRPLHRSGRPQPPITIPTNEREKYLFNELKAEGFAVLDAALLETRAELWAAEEETWGVVPLVFNCLFEDSLPTAWRVFE